MPHIVMSIASGNHSKSLPLFLWCVVDHIKAGMRLGVMLRTSAVHNLVIDLGKNAWKNVVNHTGNNAGYHDIRLGIMLGRMLKITLEIMPYNAGDPSIVGLVLEIVLRLRC